MLLRNLSFLINKPVDNTSKDNSNHSTVKRTQPKAIKQAIVTSLLVIVLLSALRIVWIKYITLEQTFQAENGVLDLTELSMAQFDRMHLNGAWSYYPNQFISLSNLNQAEDKAIVDVPQKLSEQVSHIEQAYYGTYHLKILLPEQYPEQLRIYIPLLYSAGNILIDESVIGSIGQMSSDSSQHQSKVKGQGFNFEIASDLHEVHLFIQFANPIEDINYGITSAIQLGEKGKIIAFNYLAVLFEIVTMLFFLIHAVYAFIILLFNKHKIPIFVFILFFLFAILNIGFDDTRILNHIFNIPAQLSNKLQLLSFSLSAMSLYYISFNMNKNKKKNVYYYSLILLSIVSAITLIIVSKRCEIYVYVFNGLLLCLQYVFAAYHIIKLALKSVTTARILLIAATTALVHHVFWGAYKHLTDQYLPFYPFDIWIYFFLFAIYWYYLFHYSKRQNEQLTKDLLAANEAKEQLIANTSHELRNPLQAILNLSQSSLERINESSLEQKRNDMHLTLTIARKMSRIIDDLFDYTRLKHNKIQLNISPVDLHSVVHGIFDMLRYLVENERIKLYADLPEHAFVYADEQRLIQIIFNLVHNAIKYTDEGSVVVKARIVGNQIKIEVIDTGIGIENANSMRIFKPFEQEYTQRQVGGMGLGLAICQQLVHLHGSELHVQSEVSIGSVFHFSLERAKQKRDVQSCGMQIQTIQQKNNKYSDTQINNQVTSSHTAPSLPYTDLIKILIVDDDYFNLRIIKSMLQEPHYELTTVNNGEEALSKLNKTEFHLVISDIMMPVMSGYELTKQIRKRFSRTELPILLLTARTEPEDIETSFQAGANDYVKKPLETVELRARVQALTELKQAAWNQRRMEAAWLQAQIQPHFIFNTLNAISALSEFDQPRMKELLHTFSNYLRLSYNMNNASRLVELRHELELVKAYLYIEKQRFEERLRVVWNIDDALLDTLIPPLTIQPLVENALRHGILIKPAGGTLRITVSLVDKDVHISVSDDGVGIPPSLQEKLFKQPDRAHHKGIGLLNTNRRLLHVFAEELKVTSESGTGTTISFKVPVTHD